MVQQSSAITIFCCYAREDEDLLDKLKRHLSPLKRRNVIHVWHDGDIRAGTEWEPEIKNHLNDAKIILLLISADFINSDYCYSTEMQHALERHKRGEARVIPVLLRPVGNWEKLPPGDIQLGQLRPLPKDAKPITLWANRDEAWKDVTEGISRVISDLVKIPSNQRKQKTLDKGEKLVPEVDISLYQDAFGKPTFINHQPFSTNPNYERRKFVEYVFVDEYFYLDAIADLQGKVLYFAVTIRDQSFNPTFKKQVFQIQLGRSTYSDIPGRPQAAQGCFGANWFAYYETRYFGRPGAYQEFGFGLNTAGYYPKSSLEACRRLRSTAHNCHGTLSDQEIESMIDGNKDEVFNTYAASAPGIQITDYAHVILGVNDGQVRILNS